MKLTLNEQGLVPAIAQDERTGEVLMLAFMSPEAVKKTRETGQAWFYSRSRAELWHKGATSGNAIDVHSMQVDCDGDTILLKGTPVGPVCHTGEKTCFFQELDEATEVDASKVHVIDELFQVIEGRKTQKPEGSYVAKLLSEGTDRIGKKVIEEAAESVIAAKNGVKTETVHELADLWFHSLILLASAGLTPEDVWKELRARRK